MGVDIIGTAILPPGFLEGGVKSNPQVPSDPIPLAEAILSHLRGNDPLSAASITAVLGAQVRTKCLAVDGRLTRESVEKELVRLEAAGKVRRAAEKWEWVPEVVKAADEQKELF